MRGTVGSKAGAPAPRLPPQPPCGSPGFSAALVRTVCDYGATEAQIAAWLAALRSQVKRRLHQQTAGAQRGDSSQLSPCCPAKHTTAASPGRANKKNTENFSKSGRLRNTEVVCPM